jgi:hypothetical protein
LKIILLCISITSIFLFAVFLYLINSEIGTVLKYWNQPSSINYGKYEYRLSILRRKTNINYFRFYKKDNYFIVISKNMVKSELHFMYGHFKEYGFNESNKFSTNWKKLDVKEYFDNCTIIWEKDGVTFIEPSGHKIFFPKETFI